MKTTNKGRFIHGKHGTPLYKKWKSMRGRVASHPHYVKHNITCFRDWDSYQKFEEWALNNGYKDGLSLDRVDTYGDYEPTNCRWVDKSIQAANIIIKKNNKTGYSGVSFNKQKQKYVAQIQYHGEKVYLGQHATSKEAALSFDSFVIDNKLPHTLNFGGHYAEKS